MALRNEGDLIRTLDEGTYTLVELYQLAQDAGLDRRRGAQDPAGDGNPIWKWQVRGALATAQCAGCASRLGEGAWAIRGTTAGGCRWG